MNSQQKTINLLSICRKADKLVIGFDAVKDAALEGNVSCVLVTEDISQKTLKEVKFFCGNTGTDIVSLDMDSSEMFDVLGKEVVVAAVADFGFSKRFRELGKVIKGRTRRTSKKDNSEL